LPTFEPMNATASFFALAYKYSMGWFIQALLAPRKVDSIFVRSMAS